MDKLETIALGAIVLIFALMCFGFWHGANVRAQFQATCEAAGGKMINGRGVRVCVHRDVLIEIPK
jgi:hypothetical protein